MSEMVERRWPLGQWHPFAGWTEVMTKPEIWVRLARIIGADPAQEIQVFEDHATMELVAQGYRKE